MSQQAREAESKENPKEKVADGRSLLIELDDEGKGESEEPQHPQEEEELGGENIPMAAVLDLSHEKKKCQEEQNGNYYANGSQGLQNNAPGPLGVTEEIVVSSGLNAVLIHGDF